jgi:hypothetical protein
MGALSEVSTVSLLRYSAATQYQLPLTSKPHGRARRRKQVGGHAFGTPDVSARWITARQHLCELRRIRRTGFRFDVVDEIDSSDRIVWLRCQTSPMRSNGRRRRSGNFDAVKLSLLRESVRRPRWLRHANRRPKVVEWSCPGLRCKRRRRASLSPLVLPSEHPT